MDTSENVNEIFAALAKAQGNMKNPAKAHTNPHFKSKYADLADGIDCIRPALSEQGICYMQPTEMTDDGVVVRTVLGHTSGQWIASVYPVGKFAPHQQMGASMSYAKRQALFAMVGVAGAGEDLDGEDSKDVDTSVKKKDAPQQGMTERQSEAARDNMLDALDRCETWDDLVAWSKGAVVDRTRLFSAHQAVISKAIIEAKKRTPQHTPAAAAE